MDKMVEFTGFPKMARLSRECIVTEKIDGTNAQIRITEDGGFLVGSRNRWITPAKDNFGFARWAYEHKEELLKLGPGAHFGEWWGNGIQRGYGVLGKQFSLFNASRWENSRDLPVCCGVVPVLYRGIFTTEAVEECCQRLRDGGSVAAPGFFDAEGVVVFHIAAGTGFKKTLKNDETPKSKVLS